MANYLSETMKNDEVPRFYESSSFFSDSQYVIIALQSSQGFIFNQDLFASPYQQLRAILREKRQRTQSLCERRSLRSLSGTWKRRVSPRSPKSPSSSSNSANNLTVNSVAPLAVASTAASRRSSFIHHNPPHQRRHTSFEIRPNFKLNDDDSMEVDDTSNDEENPVFEEDVFQENDSDDEDILGTGYKIGVVEIHVDPDDNSYLPFI